MLRQSLEPLAGHCKEGLVRVMIVSSMEYYSDVSCSLAAQKHEGP
jgi:hypothetical protein